jgi:hypothetical protein
VPSGRSARQPRTEFLCAGFKQRMPIHPPSRRTFRGDEGGGVVRESPNGGTDVWRSPRGGGGRGGALGAAVACELGGAGEEGRYGWRKPLRRRWRCEWVGLVRVCIVLCIVGPQYCSL